MFGRNKDKDMEKEKKRNNKKLLKKIKKDKTLKVEYIKFS